MGDVLKNQFLDSFINNISLTTIIITMTVAFVFAVYLYFVYMLTCDSVVYSKKFNITMSLIILITTAIILSMQSNIVLSLGMVGALSIVRFRTAIKEPRDLLFLFWSISLGIILGGELYSVALVLSAMMTIGLIVFNYLPGNKTPMLLIVNCKDEEAEKKVETFLKENKVENRVKSRNAGKYGIDVIYEIGAKTKLETMKNLKAEEGLENVNIVMHDGESQF